MEAQRASLCVLFADITDSTGLYESLGDEAARRVVLDCFEPMMQLVERSGGSVVERIGDELLCTFPTALGAARASCEIHRGVEATNPGRSVALSVRIGFHHGPILLDDDHVFGDTIHVARRVASLAKGQQTLTTGRTRRQIPPGEPMVIRFVDRTPLKGKSESFDIFEIVWDEEAATANATADVEEAVRGEASATLELDCGGRIVTLDDALPVVTIGRDPRADLVFPHASVSRLHARIEQRRERFVLVDQSMNGSHVIEASRPPRLVRRDELVLGSEGIIVFGPEAPDAELRSVGFRRRDA